MGSSCPAAQADSATAKSLFDVRHSPLTFASLPFCAMTSGSTRKRLIIIGAGFAGINLAKKLRHAPIEIVLVDKHNYHLFQPLLYQVATAALSPADIAYPIRRIFRSQKNVRVVLGEVEQIDLANGRVGGADAWIGYDYLV